MLFSACIVDPRPYSFFAQAHVVSRRWEVTKDNTFKLWRMSWKKSHISKFEKYPKKWGIRDSLNLQFVEQMQDLTRNSNNTQASINQKGRDLELEHGCHLFNPFLALPGTSPFLSFHFFFGFLVLDFGC